METINKEKISQLLKSKIGLSGVICEKIVNQIFAEIYEITKTEQRLTLKNFGSFFINNKKSRLGLNIKTKEQVIIAPRKVMRFTPAKALKSQINRIVDKPLSQFNEISKI